MKTAPFVFAAFVAFTSLGPAIARATPIVSINPTSDGSLYTCDGCIVVSEGAYVLASGYIQGAVKFSSALITGPVGHATLTLNPYGLPLWGKNVDVYGYGSNIGALSVADANAGVFLGTLVLPDSLGYGQDAFFDVTALVREVSSPYIAFNLRTADGGTDVFSSLEYNYGHPSQLLIATAVPEPSTLGLMITSLVVVSAFSLRHTLRHPHSARQTL